MALWKFNEKVLDGSIISNYVFFAVARHGSFAEATRRLGMTGSAGSKQVMRIENNLGLRLYHRTTHPLSLTDEGSFLFERSAPLVEGIEEIGKMLAGRKQSRLDHLDYQRRLDLRSAY